MNWRKFGYVIAVLESLVRSTFIRFWSSSISFEIDGRQRYPQNCSIDFLSSCDAPINLEDKVILFENEKYRMTVRYFSGSRIEEEIKKLYESGYIEVATIFIKNLLNSLNNMEDPLGFEECFPEIPEGVTCWIKIEKLGKGVWD